MIHFEGDRQFSLPIAAVFAKLGDASFLVDSLKDVEQIIEKSADRAIWKLRPGFSFVRTTLDITMDIVERVAPTTIKVKMFSRGIGATEHRRGRPCTSREGWRHGEFTGRPTSPNSRDC